MSTLTASIALPAVLMQAQAQAVADGLVASLTAQLARGGEAVLDASALTQFDSSALAVVLACRRAVQAKAPSCASRACLSVPKPWPRSMV